MVISLVSIARSVFLNTKCNARACIIIYVASVRQYVSVQNNNYVGRTGHDSRKANKNKLGTRNAVLAVVLFYPCITVCRLAHA